MLECQKIDFSDSDYIIGEYYMKLKALVDNLCDIIKIPNMSLFQIIGAIKKNGIRSCDPILISNIIKFKLDKISNTFVCPKCGSKLHHNKVISRSLKTSFGTINIKSPYYSCSKCKSFFEPYAKILNIRSCAYQYDLQKNIAKIASSVPFSEAAEIINDTYGYKITPDAIHQMTNELGAHAQLEELAPVASNIHSVIDEISQGKKQRPVLVFTADGAMAPVRTEKGKPNCWKENKGIRVYLVDDDHIVHVMSWHQICNKEKFIEYLQEIKKLNLFPKDKVRVCCLADGASWIWDAFEAVLPKARQILDYYHCTEHLHKFASIKFGESLAGETWIEKTKKRLFANDIRHVLAGLKRMKVSGDAEKARDSLYRYLSKNKDRVLYGKARRGGYPIGSGAIESANKFIGHVRLKRSRSWWKINNANNILKLRCGRYNKKFDQFFENFEQAHRQPWEFTKPTLSIVK